MKCLLDKLFMLPDFRVGAYYYSVLTNEASRYGQIALYAKSIPRISPVLKWSEDGVYRTAHRVCKYSRAHHKVRAQEQEVKKAAKEPLTVTKKREVGARLEKATKTRAGVRQAIEKVLDQARVPLVLKEGMCPRFVSCLLGYPTPSNHHCCVFYLLRR
jgi:hypothetical protein